MRFATYRLGIPSQTLKNTIKRLAQYSAFRLFYILLAAFNLEHDHL